MANWFSRKADYFFKEPFSELKNRQLSQGENPVWRPVFVLVMVLSLVGLLVLQNSAGISGDEYFHVEHSQDVLSYYKTFGKDKTAATPTPDNNLPYYSQLPDTVIHAIINAFGIEDYIAMRHLLCAILGWVAILYTALLARKIGGWRAAVFAAVLIFISPRFLGHTFNNLKDIPFATGCVMSVYYIVKFLDGLPKIRISTSIKLALSIAFATSVRVGGLLMVAYFGLFAILYYIYKRKELRTVFWKTLVWALGICIVGYILAVLCWPYALEGPITNVYDSFTNMSKFQISIKQIYDGRVQWSDAVPWYYSPKYMLMTIPIVVLLGFLLGLVFLRHNRKQWFFHTVLLFTALFPVIWIVADRSNVYGGWRHLLFVYPSFVVFSALGLNTLISLVKNRYAKSAVVLALCVLCIHPVSHCIRNHPFEYLYFNQLAGGVKGAYGQYEIDYYHHSLGEASKWVIENAKKDALTTGDKIIVGCWHPKPLNYFFRKHTDKFETAFIRWSERGNTDWDYAIISVTGIDPATIQNGTFPPANTVHKVEVDGVPICIVLKRMQKYDCQGYEAMQKKDYEKAEELFLKALEVEPTNETAVLGMSDIYLRKARTDSLKAESLAACGKLLDTFIKANPNNETANLMKANCLLMEGKLQDALAVCDKIIRHNSKYETSYRLAANIKLALGDALGAEDYLTRLLQAGRLSNELLEGLLSVYKMQGLDEVNAYVKLYSLLEKYYRDMGADKEADECARMLESLMQNMYPNR